MQHGSTVSARAGRHEITTPRSDPQPSSYFLTSADLGCHSIGEFGGSVDLVDYAQFGPGEDRLGGIELDQESVDLAVASVVYKAENVDTKYDGGGVLQDVGIRPHESLKQFPGTRHVHPCLDDGSIKRVEAW